MSMSPSSAASNSKRTSAGQFLFSGVGCLALGAYTFFTIAQIQATGKSEKVWAPIALLYDNFGFWPAVLLLPAIGVVSLYQAIKTYQAEHATQVS